MITTAQAFLLRRMRDLRAGCTTMPPAAVWRRCLLYYLVFLACALPLGLASGLLQVQPLRVGSGKLLGLAAYLFLRPALVEELVFRGLLLPRDSSAIPRLRLLAISAGSLSLFVVSHPLNGILFRSAALGLFTNPWFLAVAALLGATCTVAYLVSGSVWPGVAVHWLTVAGWIILLGGQGLVRTRAGAELAVAPGPAHIYFIFGPPRLTISSRSSQDTGMMIRIPCPIR
jgi:predicted Abi (CAAX) family protease